MKTAVITGTSGGIGGACALKFLENGWRVFGMSRSLPKDERITGNESYTHIRGDVSVADDRERLIDTAAEAGQIDALVNVSGIAPRVRADLLEMTEESYDEVMRVNTKATMFLTQYCANKMIRNSVGDDGVRGYICNISSLSAYATSVNRGEYCISKAGVSMITALFADRLAEYGIPVNEVRPGIIRTGMTEKVEEKYTRLIEGGLLPISRWGKPEDVADAVYALCGLLPYVTGQSVDVDGGFHMKRL